MSHGQRLGLAALAVAGFPFLASCERSSEAIVRRIAGSDSAANLGFPRQRTGLRSSTLRLAGADASPCDALPPDTAQWRANVLPTQLVDAPWISMRTPFRLPASLPGAPRPPQALTDSDLVYHLVGNWTVSRPGSPLPGEEEQGLALWIGKAAYPTEALPIGTRQLGLAECASALDAHTLFLARYSLIWRGGDTTHHLSAYLPLAGDSAIAALGRALTPAMRDELAAALRTLRVFPRLPS